MMLSDCLWRFWLVALWERWWVTWVDARQGEMEMERADQIMQLARCLAKSIDVRPKVNYIHSSSPTMLS